MPVINPFVPHNPIGRQMFIGRTTEIARLESVLMHAKNRKPINFLITGERGIGKTSLLYYLMAIARSYGDTDEESYNFLIVDIAIEERSTLTDIVKKIAYSLNKELAKTERAKEYLSSVWKFVQRLEVAGFSIEENQSTAFSDESLIIEELGNSLMETVSQTSSVGDPESIFSSTAYDGILILIDEADQSSDALGLGRLLKYLTEYLRKNDCSSVTFGLCGLPTTARTLTKSHPSSLRIFEEIPLSRLSSTESLELLDMCLLNVDDPQYRLSGGARKQLLKLGEGHPHFLHQLGYCAFNACVAANAEPDHRNIVQITEQHMVNGAYTKRGALDLIGEMYFEDFFNEISANGLATRIVRFIGGNREGGVSAMEIADGLKENGVAVEHTLQQLRSTEHIVYDKHTNQYALRYRCLGQWIQLQTQVITMSGNQIWPSPS